jgi:hypothetical protein
VLVETYAAELVVFRRWSEFHRETLGFTPCWVTYARAELQAPKVARPRLS